MAQILIVDDRSTNRNIFSRLAQSIEDDISVFAFGAPLEALEWLKDHSPDLVITDYRMPGMDGAAFTAQIRNSANGADVPVIVITAYDDRNFRLHALEAGATDFLSSPVDYCEFTTRARNLLKLHRQQRYMKGRAQTLEHQLRLSELSNAELVRSSREALAQVIDTVPAMVSATDRQGRAAFVNAHFAAFTDSTPEALIGSVLANAFVSDRRDYAERVDASFFDGAQESVSFEEKVVDPSGIERVFLTTKKPMHDGKGNVISVLTTSIDISERKQAERTLRHIALHDTLTDLPNRRMLYERIQHEMSAARGPFALHMIDLDRFKAVNDAFGHAGGDRILQQVTARLNECVPDQNLVARMSGDEFVVLQANIGGPDDAEALAHRIIDRLSAPLLLEGHEIRVGGSIGITLSPRDGTNVDRLLKFADHAMYRAKSEGRNTLRFYSPEMEKYSQSDINLESDLRKAIRENQFVLHYQPQIDLASGHIVGVEALLRWLRPGFGMTPPNVFLSLAEESSMIGEIGAWVLQEACHQAAIWQQSGLPPIRMAVNLSPLQFLRQDLAQLVSQTLESTGLDPHCLELELTESGLLEDSERTKTILRNLKDLGVRIAIDDFGVGFSSLSYVKNFPIDTLKVDRSFIANLAANSRDEAIVKAIITLATSLGLKVIAEGVETAQQLACLSNHPCDEVQGYLFSRPVASDALMHLLRDRPKFLVPKQNPALKKGA